MPYSLHMIGPDLTVGTATVQSSDNRTAAQVTAGLQPYKSGTTTVDNTGRNQIYAKTSAAIANGARCDYVFATGLMTPAASGAYVNLATNAAGDIAAGGAGWFAAVQNYTAATGILTAAPP